MAKRIQIFEHDRLTVGDDGFESKHLNALAKFNKKHRNEFFELEYNSMKMKSYVGVIQVGNISIEVLPKADKNASDNDKNKWHNALLQMLALCRYIKLKSLTNANLRMRSASIFELYIESFLSEVEELLRQGLQKKYRAVRENTVIFKGKLILAEHIKRNFAAHNRFFNEYDVYDYNNKFNQIIYKALLILRHFDLNPDLKARISQILLNMPEISEEKITADFFPGLKYTRATERYENAIKLAKLIILNFSPDISSGKENVMAILFDMNKLFEEFTYRILKRFAGDNVIVKRQISEDFWKPCKIRSDLVTEKKGIKYVDDTNWGHPRKRRPDLVIEVIENKDKEDVRETKRKVHDDSPEKPENVKNQVLVVDTKWKVPDDKGPSDEDLDKMYVYSKCFDCKQTILLYPNAGKSIENEGKYIPDENITCAVKSYEIAFDDKNKILDYKKTGSNLCEALSLKTDKRQ